MTPRGDAAKLSMDCIEDWLLKQLFSRSSTFKDSVAVWQLGYTYEKAAGFCQSNMLQACWKMVFCIRWTFLSCWWIAVICTYPEREENLSLLAVASCQWPVDLEEVDFESGILSTVQCCLLPPVNWGLTGILVGHSCGLLKAGHRLWWEKSIFL